MRKEIEIREEKKIEQRIEIRERNVQRNRRQLSEGIDILLIGKLYNDTRLFQ